jgi:hypothetical protein
MTSTIPPSAEDCKRLEVEYSEVCEHYRKGAELIFEVSKLYMYFQFGLGAAIGFITTNAALQLKTSFKCGLSVDWPIFWLSVIGMMAGIGAHFIAKTFFLYAEVGIKRGIEIEKLCGWRLMTDIYTRAFHTTDRMPASRVAIILFSMIGLGWALSAYNSVEGSRACITYFTSR